MLRERRERRDLKGLWVRRDRPDRRDLKERPGLRELLDLKVLRDSKDLRAFRGIRGLLDLREPATRALLRPRFRLRPDRKALRLKLGWLMP